MTVALIPYACGLGGSDPDYAFAPIHLAEAGLVEAMEARHIPAGWLEGLEPWDNSYVPPAGSNARAMIVESHLIDAAENVILARTEQTLPCVIGGDKGSLYALASGLAEAEDAAGDLGILCLTPTGAANPDALVLEDQVTATLLGEGDPAMRLFGGQKRLMRPEHLCLVGTVGNKEDLRWLRTYHVAYQEGVDADAIAEHGWVEARQRIVSIDARLWFGPYAASFLPGALMAALDGLLRRVPIHGVDVHGIGPGFDPSGALARQLIDLICLLCRQHTRLHRV